jgi:hypothetical protein
MTAALLRLVQRISRQIGPHAADALVRAIHAWTIDPSNAEARARLVGALTDIARRAGGMTSKVALRAAARVERYRRSITSWERELIATRYAIPQHPTGEVRAAALETYLGLTDGGPQLVARASRPGVALREVSAALECERRMLATEALGPGERQLALQANAEARAACIQIGLAAAVASSRRETPEA